MSFQKLYERKSLPNSAFLLEEGNVFFYLNNTDKYSIKGKKLIIGATELIMRQILKQNANREETAVATESSVLKRITIEKFMAGMQTFPFLLNVSAVIAKQVSLTNDIIKDSMEELGGDEYVLRDFSVKYFSLVEKLREEHTKRKYPWLSPLVKDGENNLTYKRGEAYSRSSMPLKFMHAVDISESMTKYEAGSTICEKGSAGSEMYILRSGHIDVIVNEKKIAAIEEEGTVVGEMAMLLDGERTATLVAKNDVVLSRITKEDLKKISLKDLSLMKNIMESLAKRHYYNAIRIGDINEKIASMSNDADSNEQMSLRINQAQEITKKLIEKIEKLYMEKKQDFLKEIVKSF